MYGTYIEKSGTKDYLSAVVQDVNGRLLDSGEALDGLLHRAGAGGARHSGDGEEGLGFCSLHAFFFI